MTEWVILVDENDIPYGVEEKMKAHETGKLHRAFSVFLLTKEHGKIMTLLQRRNQTKYHCGGLWSNTCCSHPRPDESILDAGKRRLMEEMGIALDTLKNVGNFVYQAKFDNGLTEHEFDHVLLAYTEKSVPMDLNTYEVSETKWLPLDEAILAAKQNPQDYTPWFVQAAEVLQHSLEKQVACLEA